MNKVFAAADIALTQAQELLPLLKSTLCVPQNFFYGSRPASAGHTRRNAARPQNAGPVLSGSDLRASRPAGVTPPSPAFAASAAQAAGAVSPQVLASDKRWLALR